MSKRTADRLVELIDPRMDIATLDITGGAPELMEQFRPWSSPRARGVEAIDRCNLTVLYEPGQETSRGSSPIT